MIEQRIRARYQEMKAMVRQGEIKLADDLAVVERDTVEREAAGRMRAERRVG